MIIWFTGISGSGKSVYAEYMRRKYGYIIIDGDELRETLCSDLGHTLKDKLENGRRMIELCKFLGKHHNVAVASIAHDKKSRKWVWDELRPYNFHFIWIDCSVEECKKRDPKGLYSKDLYNFVGKNIKYEEPTNHSLHLDTEHMTKEDCFKKIDKWMLDR